jgi:hypothetical protein
LLVELEALSELGGYVDRACRRRGFKASLGRGDRLIEATGGRICRRQGIESRHVTASRLRSGTFGETDGFVCVSERRVGRRRTNPGQARQGWRQVGSHVERRAQFPNRIGDLTSR